MIVPSFQQCLEHAGVFVAASTGVLAAKGKRVDLFGILVLALAAAFGGGTTRDVLVGDVPVVWLRGPEYLINVTVATLLTFVVGRSYSLPRGVLLVADACALALFTMIGTRKGLSLAFSAPVSMLLGVVTGVAGGILRDVLIGEMPLVFQPEIRLYATAALCGSGAFVALVYAGAAPAVAMLIGAGLVLALRLAGIYWKISLPLFKTR